MSNNNNNTFAFNLKMFIGINKVCSKFTKNTDKENIKCSQQIIERIIACLNQPGLSKNDIDLIDRCLCYIQNQYGDCAGGTILYSYVPTNKNDVETLLMLKRTSTIISHNMLHSLSSPKDSNKRILPSDIFPINFCFKGYFKALLKAHPEMAQFSSEFSPIMYNLSPDFLDYSPLNQTQIKN